ncbi:MAG: transcriptional regulator [Oscillospiraceae bacterium]|nr:transcriptional regulator [Oscillospiraceae bacterium]
MQFSEKLDLVMHLTNTSNSALATNVNIDPSHISRLRRGERRALKNEGCVAAMASYFARHCGQTYQKKVLMEALDLDFFPDDEKILSGYIAKWLLSGDKSESVSVESFLSGFAKTKNRLTISSREGQSVAAPENAGNAAEVYYGIEGKRAAVIKFLSTVTAKEGPQMLLLFSDEATDWMADDHAFAAQWAFLMSQFLSGGGRIKIIHTVNRDLDEMMSAISQWMPLYMTGSIEPYYYPKKRDGVFKRTLFIAPGTSAVVSTSVGGMRNQAANVLLKDSGAVEAYEREFLEYLKMCRPLMHFFAANDKKSYFEALREFENVGGDAFIKTNSLSLVTMPESVFLSAAARLGSAESGFIQYQKERTALFDKNIRSYSFTEIITLPDIEAAASGSVKISFCDMLADSDVFYTAEEYARHLENLLLLLRKHENFHVKLAGGSIEESYMLYVKDDVGAIVTKTAKPHVILAIGENNMTAAFWDYLKNAAGSVDASKRGREAIAKKLTEYIAILERAPRHSSSRAREGNSGY